MRGRHECPRSCLFRPEVGKAAARGRRRAFARFGPVGGVLAFMLVSGGPDWQPRKPTHITSITATPNVLWPPNSKMVSISLNVGVTGDPTPICQISSVASSESSTTPGELEWLITGPLSLSLRADRAGFGPGRVYKCRGRRRTARGRPALPAVIRRPNGVRQSSKSGQAHTHTVTRPINDSGP